MSKAGRAGAMVCTTTLRRGAVMCQLQVSPSLRITTAQLACRANANHGWSAYGGGKSRRCFGRGSKSRNAAVSRRIEVCYLPVATPSTRAIATRLMPPEFIISWLTPTPHAPDVYAFDEPDLARPDGGQLLRRKDTNVRM